MIVMMMFYIISRFRLPMAVLFIPYAAFAIKEIYVLAVNRDTKKAVWLLIPILIGIFSMRTITAERVNYRAIDIAQPFQLDAVAKLDEAADNNDFETIIEIYEQYAQMMPKGLNTFNQSNPPITNREIELTRYYASHFEAYADILQGFGRASEANAAKAQGAQLRNALLNTPK